MLDVNHQWCREQCSPTYEYVGAGKRRKGGEEEGPGVRRKKECKPPSITKSLWGPYFERQKVRECPSWLHPTLIQVCKVNSKAIWISLPIWSNLQYTFAFTLLFKVWDFPFFRLTHMYSSRQPSLFTDKTHIRKKKKKTHHNSQHYAENSCWKEEAKLLIIMFAQ